MSRSPLLRHDRELRCPRDGQRMGKVVTPHVVYDRCVRCQGLWFDATELARFSRSQALEEALTRTVPVSGRSPFPCPRCEGGCMRTQVGSVAADACSACRGMWLDAGELDVAMREAQGLRDARGALTPLQRLLLWLR